MDISEIIGLIPEDKRESAKAELAAYVPIKSKDDAERLAREHPHIKSVFDAGISRAVASHDERFIAEKLPGIVESEIGKRNPPKDPRDAKLAEMEAKLKDMERLTILEKQTSRAIAKAAEKGIPADLARKYVGMSDEETDSALETLAGVLVPWRDEAVKAVKVSVFAQGTPKRGDSAKVMNAAEFNILSPKEQASYMQSGGTLED
jgi:hypothetical protein